MTNSEKEIRKVKVCRLNERGARIVPVKKVEDKIRVIKPVKLPPLLESLYNVLNGLTYVKQLINEGKTLEIKEITDIVSEGTLKTFVKYYMEMNIDKLKRSGTYEVANLVANTLIFVNDYMYTLKGKPIVNMHDMDVVRHLLNIRDADIKKLYTDDFNFLMKDFKVMNMGEHIPSKKKAYKGSQVFINLGNGIFKAIPYKYYRKLDNISHFCMDFHVQQYMAHHGEGESEMETVMEREIIATNVPDIFKEILEFYKKYDFLNADLIPSGLFDSLEINSEVLVKFKDGRPDETYVNVYSFVEHFVPGGFYL